MGGWGRKEVLGSEYQHKQSRQEEPLESRLGWREPRSEASATGNCVDGERVWRPQHLATGRGRQTGLIPVLPALPAPGELTPLMCLSWNSERKRVMRSDGMAKEMPAVTFRVLMPMTSPSCAGQRWGVTGSGPQGMVPAAPSGAPHCCGRLHLHPHLTFPAAQ